ncbi:MAG: 50S ribosomal protein L35 [Candidatus Omnitrophota bacterium]|nr:MAG: 50S ribosomal protein L35 [Candidatus Omnitrophota bacterium]
MKKLKLKIRKSVEKRFKLTGKGKIRRNKAYGSHLLTKKRSKRMRRLKTPDLVNKVETKKIKKLLGLG